MLKIRVGHFELGRKEKRIINEVLESGRLSEGAKVNEFERKWAQFIGSRYCVAVSSGTGALITGLCALKNQFNLTEKRKILTSPLTFIATVNSIVAAGFEPVFADVDRDTFVLDVEDVEAVLKREKDVAVIVPVHLMGYPTDMDQIDLLAKKYGLLVMEDSAQAHGTRYKGKRLGTFSRLGCYSFYIAHNIQAGEMGAVVTDDSNICRLLRKIKAHGRMCECSVCTRAEGTCARLNSYRGEADFDPRFYHDMFGYNFKTMEFQAALGLVQLEKADDNLRKRKHNVRHLNRGLSECEDRIQLPMYSDDISYLAYPIIIRDPKSISRRRLRQKLEEAGIETRPLFGCIPTQQPAYKHLYDKYIGCLPNAQYLGANGFYIGCHQYLRNADLQYTVSKLKEILDGKYGSIR